MNIGAMNVRIIIQKNAVTTDDIGNHMNAWEDYFSCWATASGQSGDEGLTAGQTVDTDRMDLTVRYSSETAAVKPGTHRIIMGDRIYNRAHVDDMAFKHRSLKIHASLVRR